VNWTEDTPFLAEILADLELNQMGLPVQTMPLPDVQAAYRRTFGVTGSLCYETEYGLPHEFRQSQEMADLNGFYQAFGFTNGGIVRERSDHLAVELEFMHILALKEASAANQGLLEQVEICRQAQGKFLQEHLGRWIDWFTKSVGGQVGEEAVYALLACFAAAFIKADAARLGTLLEERQVNEISHTPFELDFSCATCPAAEMGS
jgi:TorA maturation chaperone TorD